MRMRKSIKVMLAGLLLAPVLALGVTLTAPMTAGAACDTGTGNLNVSSGADCSQGTGVPSDLFGQGSIFQTITDVALYVIGALSVLMLIYGGIRYTISGGDTKNVTDAKNTILYAVVGIVVAIMAYAIVHFVIGKLVGGS